MSFPPNQQNDPYTNQSFGSGAQHPALNHPLNHTGPLIPQTLPTPSISPTLPTPNISALAKSMAQNPGSPSSGGEEEGPTKEGQPSKKPCLICKQAHTACDRGRPCSRCVRLGKESFCTDPPNKKRGRPLSSTSAARKAAKGKAGASPADALGALANTPTAAQLASPIKQQQQHQQSAAYNQQSSSNASANAAANNANNGGQEEHSIVLNKAYRVVAASNPFCVLLGYQRSDLIGHSIAELIPEVLRDTFLEEWHHSLMSLPATEPKIINELTGSLRHKEGNVLQVSARETIFLQAAAIVGIKLDLLEARPSSPEEVKMSGQWKRSPHTPQDFLFSTHLVHTHLQPPTHALPLLPPEVNANSSLIDSQNASNPNFNRQLIPPISALQSIEHKPDIKPTHLVGGAFDQQPPLLPFASTNSDWQPNSAQNGEWGNGLSSEFKGLTGGASGEFSAKGAIGMPGMVNADFTKGGLTGGFSAEWKGLGTSLGSTEWLKPPIGGLGSAEWGKGGLNTLANLGSGTFPGTGLGSGQWSGTWSGDWSKIFDTSFTSGSHSSATTLPPIHNLSSTSLSGSNNPPTTPRENASAPKPTTAPPATNSTNITSSDSSSSTNNSTSPSDSPTAPLRLLATVSSPRATEAQQNYNNDSGSSSPGFESRRRSITSS